MPDITPSPRRSRDLQSSPLGRPGRVAVADGLNRRSGRASFANRRRVVVRLTAPPTTPSTCLLLQAGRASPRNRLVCGAQSVTAARTGRSQGPFLAGFTGLVSGEMKIGWVCLLTGKNRENCSFEAINRGFLGNLGLGLDILLRNFICLCSQNPISLLFAGTGY